MSSEKALSDEILQDARKKADRARRRAEREARRIVREAEEEAQEDRQKTLEAARQRAERQARSLLATLDQEVQRDLLEQRQAQLDRLFDAARERLADRESYHYPAVLAHLAAEAIEAMGAEQVVVELAEEDAGLATEQWLERVREGAGREVDIEVADEPAPIEGGVVVRSADGRLCYDNSFEARLRRLRPRLRHQIAAMAYPEGGGERPGDEEKAETEAQ